MSDCGAPLPTTCVVGAGPAGLAAARSFLAHGLPVEVFERHNAIGGLWDPTNEGTAIYESAHFISSKTMSGFPEFPMPDRFPDYPSHGQILEYLRSYAETFDLHRVITTGCGVTSADWNLGRWQVKLADGRERSFDHLICANGTQWHPEMPEYPGEFNGEMIHSVEHWSADRFRGKRVLVIGAGNSGVDIACDAATAADFAAISMRRGYHIIPKHILGQPADVFGATGPDLPPRVTQAVFGKLLRLLVGDLTRLGLAKPDHKLFETHPILNSEILHYLSHGDLVVRRDVERFDGATVHFVDGTSDEFDLIVLATGYRIEVPYLDNSHFEWHHNRPQLYLNAFHRSNPQLHAIGFAEGDGGAYTAFELTADSIAGLIRMLHSQPHRRQEWLDFVATDDSDVGGGFKRVDSPRHTNYLHLAHYQKQLAALGDRFSWAKSD